MKFNYVRTVAFFILLLSVATFTSCSSLSGGGDDTTTDSALVGNWKLVKATFTGETAEPSDFAGFTVALNSTGTYTLLNPNSFPSPTGVAGTYQSDGQFLTFDTGVTVRLVSFSGNTMIWEWQVAKPGKITATYTYTFERR